MTAVLLRKMRDMGLSMDQAIELMEVWEAGVAQPVPSLDEAAERRRAYDRERKRKIRGHSAENPRTDADKERPQTPKETSPIPPLKGGTFPAEIQQHPGKPEGISAEAAVDDQTPPRSARRKPERPIPADFPSAELIAEAQAACNAKGADVDAETEAEKFRNHAAQTDRRCRDWSAAWRNWTMNAVKWAPKIAGVPIRAGHEDPWKDRLTRWRIAKYWDSDWGPKPGREGYLGPPVVERAA